MTSVPLSDRNRGLLIRVWSEPDDPDTVRARLFSVHGDGETRAWSTAAGEPAVLAALEEWVRLELRGGAAEHADRPPEPLP